MKNTKLAKIRDMEDDKNNPPTSVACMFGVHQRIDRDGKKHTRCVLCGDKSNPGYGGLVHN